MNASMRSPFEASAHTAGQKSVSRLFRREKTLLVLRWDTKVRAVSVQRSRLSAQMSLPTIMPLQELTLPRSITFPVLRRLAQVCCLVESYSA
jgi:hypothetical protein